MVCNKISRVIQSGGSSVNFQSNDDIFGWVIQSGGSDGIAGSRSGDDASTKCASRLVLIEILGASIRILSTQ